MHSMCYDTPTNVLISITLYMYSYIPVVIIYMCKVVTPD